MTGVVAMLICVAPGAALIGGVPSAFADADTGGAVLDAPTLSLADLGSDATVSFYGSSSTTDVSFPVPPGLAPVSLNTTVDLPFNMRSGTLSVMQDNRLIAKLGLPLADMAPLVIPLDGAQVVDDRVALALTLTVASEDGNCLDYLNPVDFINTTVSYAGTEAPPATVADYLPSVLHNATIAVPANPSQAESDAAVQLAADLVAKYRSQKPQIALVALPGDASALDTPSQPMERQFVIKEGPDTGISLIADANGGVPQLLISGTGSALTKQARFLADPSVGLAASRKAVADDVHSDPALPGDSATLEQLGQPGLTAVGKSPEVTISLDQTRFGHSTEAYRLHLTGSYTPIPSTIGAQLTATVNGKIVDRWAADSSGVVDHWVDIPDQMVDRRTNVVVGVDTAGDLGQCGEFQPITLSISGSSVVMSDAALPPIPAGLRSLPQALMPTVVVGIGTDGFADTVRAVQIVSGLQGLSATPLSTKVTSLEEALKGRDSAILISSGGWTDSSITLPVSANDRTITVDGPASTGGNGTNGDKSKGSVRMTLDPGVGFGSLQTVVDTQRTLLIATSTGAPDQLDALLGWLGADPQRWSQVRGSAIVAFPGRAPVTVVDRTPVLVASGPSGRGEVLKATYTYSPAWLAAGGVVAVAVIGAAVIALSARRSRSDRDS